MEILKGFTFDLQLHAATAITITEGTVSGPSSDTTKYYLLSEGTPGGTVASLGAETSTYTKGNYYIGVTLKGSTYSYAVYVCNSDGDEPVDDTDNYTATFTTLNFTSNVQDATVGSTWATTGNFTTSAGGSVTIGTDKFQSIAGMESTIENTTANNTLTKGSLVFDKTTAATATTINIGSAGKTVSTTLAGTQTFTVSADYVISDITAGTSFTAAGKTYTAESNGAIVKNTTAGTTYLMKSSSALSNLKIDFASTTQVLDGDYVTENKTAHLSELTTNTTDTTTYGTPTLQGSADGTTYVYEKSGSVIEYGYQDTNFGKYLGAVSYDDGEGIYSYDASGSSVGQTLDDTSTAGTGSSFTSITGSTGNDKITDSKATYINGNEGTDTIDSSAASASILGGAGKDSIKASGKEAYVDGGSDADEIIINGTKLYATVLGGDGDDTITSADDTTSVTGGSGADIFDMTSGAINIADYNVSEDFILTATGASAAARSLALGSGTSLTSDGYIADATGKATVTGGDYFVVNLRDSNKKTQMLAWVGENGTSLDASSLSQGVVLSGTTNSEGDTLIGGSGKDTIYAGSGDSVMGGAGNDVITLASGTGRMVAITSNSGKDTVMGYSAGFEDKDSLFLVDVDPTAATFSIDSSSQVVVKAGSSSTTIQGASADTTTKAYELLVNDKKVAVAANNTTIKASGANFADIYFGTKSGTVQSGLSFSSVDDNVTVDLSDSSKYHNINFVEGGTADTTLMGSSAKETLKSAGGNTSLYGGAGADVLVGSSSGYDNFFYGAGAGKDTITGFVDGNSDTSDRVTLLEGSNFSLDQVSRSNANTIKMTLNTSDALTVSLSGGKVDNKLQLTNGSTDIVAKVGITGSANTFTYDSEVNYYVGSTKADTLTISDSDNHEVWLDNANYVSIDVINATNSTGNLILAGDGSANTIRGGKGDSSIWGGSGSVSDSLVGGTGADTFFWGAGEGNDTVTGNSDDSVNLYTLKLSELTDWGYTSNSLYLTFGEQKLTVNGQVNDYTLEGKTWTLNRSTGEWSAKE